VKGAEGCIPLHLLIGHFSSRYEMPDEFLEETKADFENTELALEGATYLI